MSTRRSRGRRWRLNWLLRWGGLAVCVLVAGVWVVSEWRGVWVSVVSSYLAESRNKRNQGAYAMGVRGGLRLGVGEDVWEGRFYMWDPGVMPGKPRPFKWFWGSNSYKSATGYTVARCWWFDSKANDSATGWTRSITIPLWFPLALAAVPTGLVWRSELRRRRRERVGKCIKCGYDLTGLSAGSACPECGRAASPM